jgi:hypothetical protein
MSEQQTSGFNIFYLWHVYCYKKTKTSHNGLSGAVKTNRQYVIISVNRPPINGTSLQTDNKAFNARDPELNYYNFLH